MILEEVGFSREQAEASIKILVEIMEDKLANKQDLQDLNIKFHHSISEVKADLTIRMGTMLAVTIANITAIQKFIFNP